MDGLGCTAASTTAASGGCLLKNQFQAFSVSDSERNVGGRPIRVFFPGKIEKFRVFAKKNSVSGIAIADSSENAIEGKSKRLDQSMKEEAVSGKSENDGNPPSVKKGSDWSRMENLVSTGEMIEVELMYSSNGGFGVSVGSVTGFLPTGFLPYSNLSAKWKFLNFDSWMKQIGDDVFSQKSFDLSSEEDLLEFYDQERLKYYSSLVGQRIEAKVVKAERKSQIIVFSLRAEEDEKNVMAKLHVGDVVKCIVVQEITHFGLFVEVEGVPALIRPSELPLDDATLDLVSFKVGQILEARVHQLDFVRQRIYLSMKEKEESDERKKNLMAKLRIGDVVKCKIQNVSHFGIFVRFEGVPALIHRTEVPQDSTLDLASSFRTGQILEAKVHILDSRRHRIFLSLKNVKSGPVTGTVKSEIGDKDSSNGRLEAAIPDTKWDDVESLIKELQQVEGIQSVSKGRFFLSSGLAPTFQVYMASMVENKYKLLARSGNKAQEIIVQASMDLEEMKSTILFCTNRVE